MKKQLLTLSAALLSLSTTAFSQSGDRNAGLRLPTQKGSLMLGSDVMLGQLSFGMTGSSITFPASYDIGISPRAGYFIADNLMLGGAITGRFNGILSELDYAHYNSKSVGVELFARRYFGAMTERNGTFRKLRFFIEGGGAYNRNWLSLVQSDNQPTIHRSYNQFSVYSGTGVSYFITENIAIEAGLRYTHMVNTSPYLGQENQLKFQVGLKIFSGGKK